MATAAGLALDIIGAILLTLGLFRHPRGTPFGGWVYNPADAAGDRCYGTIGALYLISGFLGQLLGNAGVGEPAFPEDIYLLALATFLGGLIIAYPLFGATYILFIKQILRAIQRDPVLRRIQPGEWKRRPRWRWKLLWIFWHHEYKKPPN